MLTWFYAWRERRNRMQWFADEFLPELMTAAARSNNSSVASRLAGIHDTHGELAASTVAPASPPPSPQSLEKLNEVLQRLPDSERERLKAFVQSRGSH